MSPIATALVGMATGFASAVWLLLCWSSFTARHRIVGACHAVLALTNIVSTTILFFRLSGDPIQLPPDMSTALLVSLIGLPPLLALIPWLKTRSILSKP